MCRGCWNRSIIRCCMAEKEDHKEVTTVYQEMHQQLEKGVRKLYITMQDTSDVIFVGMLHNHQRSPRKHQCQLNWHGSVKAMEPDMFVEMVKDTAKKGVPVVKGCW